MKEAKQLKILFDSNVIIDAISQRKTGNKDSKEVFLKAVINDVNGYIVSKQITDIYFVLRKYIDNKEDIIGFMSLIDEAFTILNFDDNDIRASLRLDIKDFEDDILIKIAEKEKLDYIVTNNINDFKDSKVKAILPEDLVKLFDKKLLEKITNKNAVSP